MDSLDNFHGLQCYHLDPVKRIWFLSPMRAVKVQASLRIRAVSPEPLLLAHTSSESRGTFRQKARSLAPLNVWACAVKICHDEMLEDTNSLDGAHLWQCKTLLDTQGQKNLRTWNYLLFDKLSANCTNCFSKLQKYILTNCFSDPEILIRIKK